MTILKYTVPIEKNKLTTRALKTEVNAVKISHADNDNKADASLIKIS